MSAPALLFTLVLLFVAGLAFAPAKDLAEKVQQAARFAVLVLALGAVALLFWVRVVAE